MQPWTNEHLIHMLSTVLLQVNSCMAEASAATTILDTLRSGLTAIERITRDAIYEIRSASDDDSLAIDLVGVTLVEALSRAVEETAESMGLSSRVAFNGEERPLPGSIERLLYRIAQEALYQVQQHSNARKLRFTFSYGRDEVQMSIQDDSSESSTEEQVPLPHFKDEGRDQLGPYGVLRQRVEHLGGSLEILRYAQDDNRGVLVRMPYTAGDYGMTRATDGADKSAVAAINRALRDDDDSIATTKVRLLVVDRQAVSRAGLRRVLESYPDLQVIGEAADGVQAVSETLELGPQVVLMDAHLPNGQSMEALKQIKQLNLDAKVLLFSAQDREEYLYETLRAGADGYVLKDIVPDELAQAVRTVARGEVLVQPQLAGRLLSRFGPLGRDKAGPYTPLTAREREVLRLLARGLRNKEIAARLIVSERTVNFHLANIYQKLNVSGRTEALSKALEQGLITA